MSDATIDAIQAINASVGLTALTTYPTQVQSSQLPFCVTFAGPMDASKFGVTTYISLVLIDEANANAQIDRVFQSGTTIMKALRTAYRAIGAVNGYAIDGGGRAPTAHGGFGSPRGMLDTVPLVGRQWFGFEWHVPLLETEP